MVRIMKVWDKEQLRQITFQGHADYDAMGMDIVCAAVSATFICTVNGILSIDESAIEVRSRKGKQVIFVLKDDSIVQTLLLNMIRCLQELEVKYPKNIQIS